MIHARLKPFIGSFKAIMSGEKEEKKEEKKDEKKADHGEKKDVKVEKKAESKGFSFPIAYGQNSSWGMRTRA